MTMHVFYATAMREQMIDSLNLMPGISQMYPCSLGDVIDLDDYVFRAGDFVVLVGVGVESSITTPRVPVLALVTHTRRDFWYTPCIHPLCESR